MLATESFRDLGQMLSYRSATMPARRAFGFISGGAGTTCATIDRAELDLRARQIASALHESGAMEGARVLLVTPAGIDFVSSLFGCFYAGAIPVPLFPPREGRLSRRFQHVVRDSGARHIIQIGRAHV